MKNLKLQKTDRLTVRISETMYASAGHSRKECSIVLHRHEGEIAAKYRYDNYDDLTGMIKQAIFDTYKMYYPFTLSLRDSATSNYGDSLGVTISFIVEMLKD